MGGRRRQAEAANRIINLRNRPMQAQSVTLLTKVGQRWRALAQEYCMKSRNLNG